MVFILEAVQFTVRWELSIYIIKIYMEFVL
jgi:hypothetical protein